MRRGLAVDAVLVRHIGPAPCRAARLLARPNGLERGPRRGLGAAGGHGRGIAHRPPWRHAPARFVDDVSVSSVIDLREGLGVIAGAHERCVTVTESGAPRRNQVARS